MKDGLEQFQRPSKQHLRHRLHFNGAPLGIFGQSQRKRREEIAPKSLTYENPAAFRHYGPPPPRQAAGDLARAARVSFRPSNGGI